MKRNIKTFNRYFSAILYPEDTRYNDIFNFIIKNYTEVTWIKHDRDINVDGEIKKEHVHIVFKVGENARSVKQIAEEMKYTIACIEGCNHEAMLLYLLHKNNPEKTQYKEKEVQGETKLLHKLIQKSIPSEEKIIKVLNEINQGHIQSVTTLLYWATRENCLEEVKKMQFLLYKAIEEKWKRNVDKEKE